ncbi:BspA family leucine-rich repeat surface protein [Helicobacter labetoulli]|nr:BspA family leucine-rich repeat surface protein [Helicobacter labetoulli]
MKIKPKNKNESIELLRTSELSDIDTSLITDMSRLFLYSGYRNRDFRGIETWNVSNVTNMRNMFSGAVYFNQDISNWNVLKVEDMESMFYGAKSFNQNISSWDVKNVVDFNKMLNFYKPKSLTEFVFPNRYRNNDLDIKIHTIISSNYNGRACFVNFSTNLWFKINNPYFTLLYRAL